MDALFNRLEREGYGCWIENHYFGSIRYADDLKLLSPSVHGLRKLTEVCIEFGEEYSVQHNPQRQCILYSKKDTGAKSITELC